MEILFWIAVLTWMAKRSAEDVLHAVKGTPNPRYELKKAKAKAAGQAAPMQPRYGGKEWFADLLSDAMVANTEKRRAKAKAKAQPVDDMVDVVREPEPAVRARTRRGLCPVCLITELPADGGPCPTCEFWKELDNKLAEQERREAERKEGMRPVGDYPKPGCAWCHVETAQPGSANCPACDRVEGNYPDSQPTARIYQFPNVKTIEKEIDMSNAEATGLSTAIAFAEAAAQAHASFSTAGSEGYAGALERMGFGDGITALAAEAREQSTVAADKWKALADAMEQFHTGREFYASYPDAPDKVALVNE